MSNFSNFLRYSLEKGTIAPNVIKRRLYCTLIQKQATICPNSTDVATVKVNVRTTSTPI